MQELTVRIESLTNLGEGIAREGDTGWVVMVPHVIPGELVKCKVFRNHANYSEATLVSFPTFVVFDTAVLRGFCVNNCSIFCR